MEGTEDLAGRFVQEARQRLVRLRAGLAVIETSDAPGVVILLRDELHALAEVGGAYGFPTVSDAARAAEQLCAELVAGGRTPSWEEREQLVTACTIIDQALDAG